MIQCFGFLVFFSCELPKTPAIDSFCTSYQRIIRTPDDAKIVAPLSVKQRIAADDIIYRCTCENWKSPLCPAGKTVR